MCCRYYIDPDSETYIRAAEHSPLKERLERELSKPMLTSGEVRPTDLVPVIATDKSRIPTVFPMVWGFHLPDSKVPIINARVETAREKATFRDSWENRRCVIPVFWRQSSLVWKVSMKSRVFRQRNAKFAGVSLQQHRKLFAL